MIVASNAADIVYTNFITGVHGNYLRPSFVKSGLDPDNLPDSDPSKMNFSSGTSKPKAWRDIWGAGQGIGAVKEVMGAADLIARIAREYDEALGAVTARQTHRRAVAAE
jgi:nitronate monooxygenase